MVVWRIVFAVVLTGGIGFGLGRWVEWLEPPERIVPPGEVVGMDGDGNGGEEFGAIEFLDQDISEWEVWGLVSRMSAGELEPRLRELMEQGERAEPALWLAGEAMAARLAELDVERALALGCGRGDAVVGGMVVRAATGALVEGGGREAVWGRVMEEIPVRLRTAGVEGIVAAVGDDELGELAAKCGRGYLLGRERQAVLGSVYERWVDADVEGALASLGGVGAARDRRVRAELVGRFWADRNLDDALRWIEGERWRGPGLSGVVDGALESLINRQPWRAAELAKGDSGVGTLLKGDQHLHSLALGLVGDDPDRGWAWVMGYPEAGMRMRMLERIGSDFEVGEAMVHEVSGLADSEMKRRVMKGMIQGLGRRDPEAAIRLLGEQPEGEETTRARLDLYREWGWQDVRGAAAYFEAQGKDEEGGMAIGAMLVDQMATSDIEGALKLAGGFAGADREEVYGKIYQRWGEDDPAAALRHAKAEGYASGKNLETIYAAWARKDVAAVEARLADLDGDERRQAMVGVMNGVIWSQPAKAGGYLDTLLGEGHLSGKDAGYAADRIAEHWVETEPEAAARWAAQLEGEEVQIRAWEEIVYSWTGTDAEAASGWVAELPDGAGRDAAVSALIDGLQGNDPAAALAWAGSIGNPTAKIDRLRGVYQRWKGESEAEASAALEALDLSEEVRGKVRR